MSICIALLGNWRICFQKATYLRSFLSAVDRPNRKRTSYFPSTIGRELPNQLSVQVHTSTHTHAHTNTGSQAGSQSCETGSFPNPGTAEMQRETWCTRPPFFAHRMDFWKRKVLDATKVLKTSWSVVRTSENVCLRSGHISTEMIESNATVCDMLYWACFVPRIHEVEPLGDTTVICGLPTGYRALQNKWHVLLAECCCSSSLFIPCFVSFCSSLVLWHLSYSSGSCTSGGDCPGIVRTCTMTKTPTNDFATLFRFQHGSNFNPQTIETLRPPVLLEFQQRDHLSSNCWVSLWQPWDRSNRNHWFFCDLQESDGVSPCGPSDTCGAFHLSIHSVRLKFLCGWKQGRDFLPFSFCCARNSLTSHTWTLDQKEQLAICFFTVEHTIFLKI